MRRVTGQAMKAHRIDREDCRSYRGVREGLVVLSLLALTACESGPVIDDDSAGAAFQPLNIAFTHQWEEPSHPFTGAAVIDVDGDGTEEVFVGGGLTQADALLRFEAGSLVNIIANTGLERKTGATHGVASTDLDLDGDVDLVVARDTGVYLYLNSDGTFSERKLPLTFAQDAVPVSVSTADMDGDGDVDLYVSMFVAYPAFASATFNDPSHAKLNLVLTNTGDLTFEDTTAQSGAAGLQNTFHATFVNLDNDGDLDLVLAQNTGEIEIFDNQGDGRFTARPTKSGYGFWMGTGVGDFDQDGDQDLLVSNAGNSIPAFLTTGDINESQRHNINWALLRNDGSFQFTDVITDYEMDEYGFAWGTVFEDINLDGHLDLLVGQNYLKWPVHKVLPLPGKVLVQTVSDGTRRFSQAPGLGLDNRFYGQSPLIVDLNGDGRPDVVWLNMDGPVRAFLNQSTNDFIAVKMPDNRPSQGAEVMLAFSDGSKLRRQVIASDGLMTDSASTVYFGIPRGKQAIAVEVKRLDGTLMRFNEPALNGLLIVR